MSEQLIKELKQMSFKANTAKKLCSYLIELLNSGYKLPAGDSEEGVDKMGLSAACDFDRQSLYPRRGAKETVRLYLWAVENIGIETIQEQEDKAINSNNPDIKILQKLLKEKDKEIGSLKGDLIQLEATLSFTAKRVHELQERLDKYKFAAELRSEGHQVVLWED